MGKGFQTLTTFVIDWHFLATIVGFQPFAPVVMSFDETSAKEFRLLIKNKRNEGGVAEIELSSSPRIENYAGKTLAKMSQLPMPAWNYYMWREQPEPKSARHNIDPASVLDISEHMTADGKLTWDLRRLVADKIVYDYVGGFRELCHKNGLRTWLENYGHWGFPAEFLQYGGQSDEVAGEYWLPNAAPSWENDLGMIENRAASSCAHIYGKNIVTSESNTSGGPAFSRVPADAKQRTDKYFSEGVNSTLFHVYIHQPDLDRYPGTNAWFGTEFNRANTWFSHIDLFIDYVRRCNYMLQRGLNIADVAYFIGEDTPKMTGVQDPALPVGYQFDYINAEVIVRDAIVKNGLITLPHGTTYRVLVLPKVKSMRPEVLAKIKQLVADGAVVLGPAPTHSPSLQGQPDADRSVKQMAATLWKEVDGVKRTSAAFGKGLIFDGVSLEEVFSKIGCIEDCKTPVDAPLKFGHRKMGETDIYFISNQDEAVREATIAFRVKGMQPELWNPIDGTMRKLTEFRFEGETTVVPVTLQKYESAFIIFQQPGQPMAGTRNFPEPTRVINLKEAWHVEFQGKLTNPSPIRLNRLIDLATSTDTQVRYFSGNMLYTTTFTFDPTTLRAEDVYLDLGEVNKMAKVWVNNQYVGGAWTSPYRVNVTKALKQGINELRIDVVNTWVNRLIDDSALPKEQRETWVGMSPYTRDSQLQKSGLLGPVQLKQVPNNSKSIYSGK